MYPSIDEWIKKMQLARTHAHTHTHTHTDTHTQEYYSVIRKNEILPFAMTWMELESVMLSETSVREREMLHDFTHMWNLRNKTNEHGWGERDKPRNRLLTTENKLMVIRGEVGQRGNE